MNSVIRQNFDEYLISEFRLLIKHADLGDFSFGQFSWRQTKLKFGRMKMFVRIEKSIQLETKELNFWDFSAPALWL